MCSLVVVGGSVRGVLKKRLGSEVCLKGSFEIVNSHHKMGSHSFKMSKNKTLQFLSSTSISHLISQ